MVTVARTVLLSAFFTATAAALNYPVLRAITLPRPAPDIVSQHYPHHLNFNDTAIYCGLMDVSAAEFAAGRIYLPISDYDCTITYLLPCGAVRHYTGWQPVAILNGFALIHSALTGLFAFAFLRRVGVAAAFALPLATALQSSNYLAYLHHMGHMTQVQIGWLAACFCATAALCQNPASWRWATALGVAMAGNTLASASYTLYSAFTGLPAFCAAYWLTARRAGRASAGDFGRFVGRGGFAVFVAAALASFYLVPRLGHPPLVFPPPLARHFTLRHFMDLLESEHPTLFVGLPLMGLTVLAVNWWWSHRTPLATACLVTGVISLVMMLPALPGTPYWTFYHAIPWWKHLRVPVRFFPLFLLALTGLIGLYLTAATAGCSRRRRLWLASVVGVSLVGGNWFTSNWYYPKDPLKRILRTVDGDVL